jgi:Zn-dependent M16 (insulinase) family peptidase
MIHKGELFDKETTMNCFSWIARVDHVHGERSGKFLRSAVEKMDYNVVLGTWSDEKWRQFIRKWFLEAHHVAILGVPSESLQVELTAKENERIAERLHSMGETGKLENDRRVMELKRQNEIAIPGSLFDALPIPDSRYINWLKSKTMRPGSPTSWNQFPNLEDLEGLQSFLNDNESSERIFIQEEFNTELISIKLVLPTDILPNSVKPLIPLLIDLFFERDITSDEGDDMPWSIALEDFEKLVSSYTIEADVSRPVEAVTISLMLESQHYGDVVKKLQKFAYKAQWKDFDRLQQRIQKLRNIALTNLSYDASVAQDLSGVLMANTNPLVKHNSSLFHRPQMGSINCLLKWNPERVAEMLKWLTITLFEPRNVRVYVGGRLENMGDLLTPWKEFTQIASENKDINLNHNSRDIEMAFSYEDLLFPYQDLPKKPGETALLIPLASTASSAGRFTGSAPNKSNDPVLPAYAVTIALLNMVDGPLWSACRSSGYAYRCRFLPNYAKGYNSLIFEKCSNIYKAYSAALEVVSDLASGRKPVTQHMMEGGRDMLNFLEASEQKTPHEAAANKALDQILGWGVDPVEFLKKTSAITPEEVQRVLNDYVLDAFNPKTCNMFIVCSKTTAEVSLVQNP